MRDARRNPYIDEILSSINIVKMRVHLVTPSMDAAIIMRSSLNRDMPTVCIEVAGAALRIHGRRVQRNDGVIYDSARAAALAIGMSPSYLSKHLNRQVGYNSVKGYTFKWLT